jgi:hypothetical protein
VTSEQTDRIMYSAFGVFVVVGMLVFAAMGVCMCYDTFVLAPQRIQNHKMSVEIKQP